MDTNNVIHCKVNKEGQIEILSPTTKRNRQYKMNSYKYEYSEVEFIQQMMPLAKITTDKDIIEWNKRNNGYS